MAGFLSLAACYGPTGSPERDEAVTTVMEQLTTHAGELYAQALLLEVSSSDIDTFLLELPETVSVLGKSRPVSTPSGLATPSLKALLDGLQSALPALHDIASSDCGSRQATYTLDQWSLTFLAAAEALTDSENTLDYPVMRLLLTQLGHELESARCLVATRACASSEDADPAFALMGCALGPQATVGAEAIGAMTLQTELLTTRRKNFIAAMTALKNASKTVAGLLHQGEYPSGVVSAADRVVSRLTEEEFTESGRVAGSYALGLREMKSRYQGVLEQQGRVVLDSDWDEATMTSDSALALGDAVLLALDAVSAVSGCEGKGMDCVVEVFKVSTAGYSPYRFVQMNGDAGGVVEYGQGTNSQDALFAATKKMKELQISFNLQYLQLQSQMQHENRSYTAISNIMKTKHDTVKNSISNVR